MTETVLAISGKPGLYKLVGRGNGMLIVETIDANKKRTPAGSRDRVTSLGDIAIYTQDEDMPLMKVFAAIRDKENGATTPINPKTASKTELTDYMALVLPNYDRERVYITDIKKLFAWYNILVENGLTDFEAGLEEETSQEEEA